MVQIDLGIIFAVLSIILAVIASLLQSYTLLRRKKREEETTEQRVTRLTKSLSEAVQLINQIEDEIKNRRVLVLKLQEDIKDYEKIVEMRRPEVEAISRLIRDELQKEGRRSFWQNFIVNLFFFALGFVANTIIAAIL